MWRCWNVAGPEPNQLTLPYLYFLSSFSWPKYGNILVMIPLEYIKDLYLPSQKAKSHRTASEAKTEVSPLCCNLPAWCFYQCIVQGLDSWLSLICCYKKITTLLLHWIMESGTTWICVPWPWALIFGSRINSLIPLGSENCVFAWAGVRSEQIGPVSVSPFPHCFGLF